jgi:hypothetical protein
VIAKTDEADTATEVSRVTASRGDAPKPAVQKLVMNPAQPADDDHIDTIPRIIYKPMTVHSSGSVNSELQRSEYDIAIPESDSEDTVRSTKRQKTVSTSDDHIEKPGLELAQHRSIVLLPTPEEETRQTVEPSPMSVLTPDHSAAKIQTIPNPELKESSPPCETRRSQ